MKIEIIKVIKYCQKHVLFITLSRQKICSLDFIGSDDGKECPSTPSNLDYSFHMIEIMHFLVRTWDIFNSFDCFQLQFETQFFKRKCDLNMTTLLQIMFFFVLFFFFTNNAVCTDWSYFKSKFHYLFEVKNPHIVPFYDPSFHQQFQSLCLHYKTLRWYTVQAIFLLFLLVCF